MPDRIKYPFTIEIHAANERMFRLLPQDAVQVLQDVLEYGADQGKSGWKDMPVAEHLDHASEHLAMHAAGDTSEPHLRHAFTRLMMAVAIDEGLHEGRGKP